MKTNIIRIRADRLNIPLAVQTVGRLSSAVFTILGDIPDDVEQINVEISRTPLVDGTARENIANVARKSDDGTWRAYISPFNFPDVSRDLKYHVVAKDASGNPRWLGSGTLYVLDNPANGSPIVPEVVPADSYAYNPVTKLYHKIIANVDEYGVINIEVESEGVER